MIRRWVTAYGEYAFVVGLGLAAQVELWVEPAYAPDRSELALLALGMGIALLFRRRAPLLTLGVAVIETLLEMALLTIDDNGPIMTIVLMMVAIYSAAAHTRARTLLVGALVVLGLQLMIVVADTESHNLTGVLFVAIFTWGPFLAGTAIRLRREREELLVRDQEERARRAVTDERKRIARELHDVVAHAISVIVLQARGARHSLDRDLDDSRDALHAIERTATEALAEMRHLLALLRSDEEAALAPQPSLTHLDTLVGHVQGTGLSVEVNVEGEPRALPPGLDASAYRIVQEALTNALKHSGRCRAVVTIRYRDDTVDLDVADDGAGAAKGETGHGLIGMRERVALFGGTIEAGPCQGGGYAVHAHLPIAKS